VSDHACVIDRGVVRFSGRYADFSNDPALARAYMSVGAAAQAAPTPTIQRSIQ